MSLETVNAGWVETGGGLGEDIECIAALSALKLSGEFHALILAA